MDKRKAKPLASPLVPAALEGRKGIQVTESVRAWLTKEQKSLNGVAYTKIIQGLIDFYERSI